MPSVIALNVTIQPSIQSVVILSDAMLSVIFWIVVILSEAIELFKINVIMLSVVMLVS
jgi:hypothetical protein